MSAPQKQRWPMTMDECLVMFDYWMEHEDYDRASQWADLILSSNDEYEDA